MKCCHLLLLSLFACVARGVSQCSSSESNTPVTVEWYCGEHVKPTNVSCSSLTDALAFSANTTATCPLPTISIHLNSEKVKLEARSSQQSHLITNMSHFGLIGVSNSSTEVVCTDRVAIRFEGQGMSVEIRNVSFQTCGDTTAALLFHGTLDVYLDHFEVKNSTGCGVSFQNVVGEVRVSNSVFTDNNVHDGYGAGVQILVELSPEQKFTANFTRCNFTRNRNVGIKGITWEQIDGGGMYISVRGFTKEVCIKILSCNFVNNIAKWGLCRW